MSQPKSLRAHYKFLLESQSEHFFVIAIEGSDFERCKEYGEYLYKKIQAPKVLLKCPKDIERVINKVKKPSNTLYYLEFARFSYMLEQALENKGKVIIAPNWGLRTAMQASVYGDDVNEAMQKTLFLFSPKQSFVLPNGNTGRFLDSIFNEYANKTQNSESVVQTVSSMEDMLSKHRKSLIELSNITTEMLVHQAKQVSTSIH